MSGSRPRGGGGAPGERAVPPVLARLAALARALRDAALAESRAAAATPADLARAEFEAQFLLCALFAARAHGADAAEQSEPLAALARLPCAEPALAALLARAADGALGAARARALVREAAALLADEPDARVRSVFDRLPAAAGDGEDPVAHFYEHFLAAYDPALRGRRGVYFTPRPLVDYVVRSVDAVLRREFADDAPDGLLLPDPDADHAGATARLPSTRPGARAVTVLDPSAGTGAFLAAVVEHARAAAPPGAPAARRLGALVARLAGYELLPAAHAVAHLRVAAAITSAGYELPPAARLSLACGDALRAPRWTLPAPGAAREALLVVLGNPPYAGHSATRDPAVSALLRGRDVRTGEATGSYFEVDGAPLGERNPKWLNDDYVKFVRFAQREVERAGAGVVAFVCGHGFVDHPTFRGMRASLLRTFDRIDVLDLHGNLKRRERPPAEAGVPGRDENVFAIQQGVAVLLLVRHARGPAAAAPLARVRRADLWGPSAVYDAAGALAGGKLHYLATHDAARTAWTEVTPAAPDYAFEPRGPVSREAAEYARWWPLDAAMPVHSVGIVTARDALVLDLDEHALRARIDALRGEALDDAAARARYLAPRDRLELGRARARLRATPPAALEASFVRCLYRPFDARALCYHDALIERPRREVMRHLLAPAARPNLALIARRQMLPSQPCTYFGVTDLPASDGVIRSDNHGSETVFPLWLAPAEDDAADARGAARANLAPEFIELLSSRLAMPFAAGAPAAPAAPAAPRGAFDARDVLHYAYAVFCTPAYRAAFAAELRRGFPRIPPPRDRAAFVAHAAAGARLCALHTLAASPRAQPAWRGGGGGEDDGAASATVGRARFEPPDRVWLGDAAAAGRFEGVDAEAWSYRMGAYAVLPRWLAARRGRALDARERARFAQIAGAIAETLAITARLAPPW